MEDKVTEKVYCYDHPSAYNNHDAMAIAAMCNNKRNDDGLMAAMMNGGINNQWNNPFIYLVWMMFAQRMWGDDWGRNKGCDGANLQNTELQNQLTAIRSQMQDNQNSNLLMDAIKGNGVALNQLAGNLNCDFNALQGAVCNVQSAIQQVGGAVGYSSEKVINAVNLGDSNVINQLQTCCCNIRTAIADAHAADQLQACQNTGLINSNIADFKASSQLQTCQQTSAIRESIADFKASNQLLFSEKVGEIRGGQRDIGSALTQGFAQLGYQQNADKCEIIQAGSNNTQRIIDALNNHWNAELQQNYNDARLEMSQLKQNQYLAGLIKGNCGCGNYSGCNC